MDTREAVVVFLLIIAVLVLAIWLPIWLKREKPSAPTMAAEAFGPPPGRRPAAGRAAADFMTRNSNPRFGYGTSFYDGAVPFAPGPAPLPRQRRDAAVSHVSTPTSKSSFMHTADTMVDTAGGFVRTGPQEAITPAGQARTASGMLRGMERDG